MSGALRKIAGNASKHNCTIIFLNQLRQKVGDGCLTLTLLGRAC